MNKAAFAALFFCLILSKLQTMEQKAARVFNFKKIRSLQNIAPQIKAAPAKNCTCSRCRYVNPGEYIFCTNCGHPLKDESSHTLYQVRTKQRKELLKKSEKAVQSARVILYILAGFFIVGIAFLFGELENRFMLAFVFIAVSALFLLLARWSLSKPFTALIAAFIIVLTFSTISIFGEFTNAFTTVQGVYSIAISMVLIYFLLKGIQGAYKSDLIKEEMEIY